VIPVGIVNDWVPVKVLLPPDELAKLAVDDAIPLRVAVTFIVAAVSAARPVIVALLPDLPAVPVEEVTV
jgi:hypothetical protein